jgi:iron complex transport system substrate-binding protein
MRLAVTAALLLAAVSAHAAERIVTLAPHLAELVCAVGACDRLVGVAEYTDAPPQAAALPQVGNAFSVNLEAVLARRPDLVLSWDGGNSPELLRRLRPLQLRVEPVTVRGLDDIGDALERVGELTGDRAAALEAAQGYRQRLQAVRREYAGRRRLRAFYHTETDPPFSVNRNSPIHAALALCGADNVFAGMPAIAGAVSLEAIVAADPDLVVYAQQEDPAAIARLWTRLSALPAADPARHVIVDANTLTRQSPRVLDGIEQLCAGIDRVRRTLD